jgi:hypothetical protein
MYPEAAVTTSMVKMHQARRKKREREKKRTKATN